MITQAYGISLREDTSSPLLKLIQTLPIERQERINRFKFPEDALRTLTADILSRWLLCRQLGIKNKDILLTYNANGKPLLQGVDDLHFNNSHSGKWVVSAISPLPVGIDVELISEMDLGIASHCFSHQEFLDLSALDDDQSRLEYFFDLWTLKESYIKAVGLGLSMELSSFTIRKNSQSIQLHTSSTSKYPPCFFKQYEVDSRYKMSICTQHADLQDKLIVMSCDELYQHFVDTCL